MAPPKRQAVETEETPTPKRQDVGATKDGTDAKTKGIISPQNKPGAFRMVKKLKASVTGEPGLQQWPAIICDDALEGFCLKGLKKPTTANEAYESSGCFLDAKITAKAKFYAVYLINKNKALWAPGCLLEKMVKTDVESLRSDDKYSKEFQRAAGIVIAQSGAKYLKEISSNMSKIPPKAYEESEDDIEDQETCEKLAEEAVKKIAALPENLNHSRAQATQKKDGPTTKPSTRAKEVTGPADKVAKLTEQSQGASKLNTENRIQIPVPSLESARMAQNQADCLDVYRANPFERVRFDTSPGQKIAIRRAKADRKATKQEVRLAIGRRNDEYIVRHAGLQQSSYLGPKIEYEPGDDQYHIMCHKLYLIDPNDFDMVADFMNTGDYEPVVVQTENKASVLQGIDRTNTEQMRTLITQSSNLCKISATLELPQLYHKALEKLELLGPYSTDDVLQILSTIPSQGPGANHSMQRSLLAYIKLNFFDLLDAEGKFRDFLKSNVAFATKVFRLMAGLDADGYSSSCKTDSDEPSIGLNQTVPTSGVAFSSTPSDRTAKKQTTSAVAVPVNTIHRAPIQTYAAVPHLTNSVGELTARDVNHDARRTEGARAGLHRPKDTSEAGLGTTIAGGSSGSDTNHAIGTRTQPPRQIQVNIDQVKSIDEGTRSSHNTDPSQASSASKPVIPSAHSAPSQQGSFRAANRTTGSSSTGERRRESSGSKAPPTNVENNKQKSNMPASAVRLAGSESRPSSRNSSAAPSKTDRLKSSELPGIEQKIFNKGQSVPKHTQGKESPRHGMPSALDGAAAETTGVRSTKKASKYMPSPTIELGDEIFSGGLEAEYADESSKKEEGSDQEEEESDADDDESETESGAAVEEDEQAGEDAEEGEVVEEEGYEIAA